MTMREKARRAMIFAYLHRAAPQLFRPGVVFTKEQEATIRAMARQDAANAIIQPAEGT